MKRVSLVLATIMVAGLFVVAPASAKAPSSGPRYHEIACSVNALAPRVIPDPRRVQGRGEVRCTNSGDPIDQIVVWTFVQWFNGQEQWQTIALNKRTFNDVASGTTLRTRAARACGGTAGFLFRTKVTTWVYDSYGDLRLKKKDTTPGAGAVRLNCGNGTTGF